MYTNKSWSVHALQPETTRGTLAVRQVGLITHRSERERLAGWGAWRHLSKRVLEEAYYRTGLVQGDLGNSVSKEVFSRLHARRERERSVAGLLIHLPVQKADQGEAIAVRAREATVMVSARAGGRAVVLMAWKCSRFVFVQMGL